ncbi:MAG: carbohydrate-binding protein [Kiritimatiellaceae bacterium]|nr:carbohydrate-binding protein [Kiritimatiellaceae bacterium]
MNLFRRYCHLMAYVLLTVLGLAAFVYADGSVNYSIDARQATSDSDGDLRESPVRICKPDNFVGWVRRGSWIRFTGFDFGSGPILVEVVAGTKRSEAFIAVRQGSPDGFELGRVKLASTGDTRVFDTFTAPLMPNNQSSGIKDLFLCFECPDNAISLRSFTLFDGKTPLPQPKPAASPQVGAVASDSGSAISKVNPPSAPENPVDVVVK